MAVAAQLGFSIEWTQTAGLMGPDGLKPSFVALLDTLAPADGPAGGPPLRIGGDSADESVWNPDGALSVPAGTSYNISRADMDRVYGTANATGSDVVFDLSFALADDPSWAAAHVREGILGADGQLPAGVGVEIGNEPDLMAFNGLRPLTYSYADYKAEFDAYAAAVGVPASRIQAGTFNSRPDFMAQVPAFVADAPGGYMSFCEHKYPLTACLEPLLPIYSVGALLKDWSSKGMADRLQPRAAAAAAAGVAYVVGETNSVSCSGAEGVSDVFAAALWAVDYAFELSRVGVSVANFHGGRSSTYGWVHYDSDADDVPQVMPLYYGLWAFSDSAPPGSALFNVSVSLDDVVDGVKVWGAAAADGQSAAVVAIAKDLDAAAPVNLTLAAPAGVAPGAVAQRVDLLSPGGVGASAGISYGGQTLDGSQDGRPVGERVETPVEPNADGTYSVEVAPLSAAVVRFSLGG